ncbi:MAG: nuclear transport factor 2 family protein [Actinomycetales bacterium]
MSTTSQSSGDAVIAVDQSVIDRDKAVIARYLDAVGALAVDDIAPLFSPQGRVVLPYAPAGIPPVIAGREAIDDYYQALPGMAGPMNFAEYRISATETPGEYVARYTSDSVMLATGKRYANTYITTVLLENGEIVELSEYFDPILLVEALGGTVSMTGGDTEPDHSSPQSSTESSTERGTA